MVDYIMNKIKLYLKQIFALATGSKLRLVLTFLGTLIGVYIFSVGNLALESVYHSQLEEVKAMPDNAFYALTDDASKNLTESVLAIDTKMPIVERVSATSHVIYEDYEDDIQLIVYATMHGVSQMGNSFLERSTGYGINMSCCNIIEGRGLSSKEIMNNERVCIIDEHTKELIFGDEAVVGNYIYFNKYNGGIYYDGYEELEEVAYQVVGVIENTFYTKKNIGGASKVNNMGQQYEYVNIICPYKYYENINEPENIYEKIGYLWECDSKQETSVAKELVSEHIEVLMNTTDIANVIDKEFEYTQIQYELNKYDVAIKLITVVLFLIMGISCMSIIFFSMKERVNEIGIKKAFGATASDIIFQFILENLLIILASVMVASVLSLITVKMCEGYIQENFYRYFTMYIIKEGIIFPMGLGIAQGLLFTLIPCIRYSAIHVTKALKLEK